ncbi:MAG: Gfo/Idh/MocA family oxidoreductase, partial [Prolixibacteraceae bacterium]|nr:Gfo/Idh/MocA family oxidoreductase [Prolixibacteraceae bacterium]
MPNERREFIKKTGLLGIALAGSGLVGHSGEKAELDQFPGSHSQKFNMHGYVAPKLDVVRAAVIGLGNRGSGTVRRLASIEGVEIKALCDVREEKVKKAADMIRPFGQNPDHYTGENDWKTICERQDIDLVAVVTPWHFHTPMCVYAMEHDKHAYTELPAALTIDECWQLVETSERKRRHCIQMSGNCSGGTSAVILNMVREGFFGDIVHAEGAYIHDLIPRHMFVDQRY